MWGLLQWPCKRLRGPEEVGNRYSGGITDRIAEPIGLGLRKGSRPRVSLKGS